MNLRTTIEEKLLGAFSPIHLDVINESNKYKRLPQKTSYFKVIIVSEAFVNARINQRHRAITSVLATELIEKISGLTLHTYTEKEWQDYYADTIPLSAYSLTSDKIA